MAKASPKQTDSGRKIVAAKIVRCKKSTTRAKGAPSEVGQIVSRCGCVPVSTEDGFVFNYDGAPVIVGGMPQTGGPWIPAVYPNGQTVWLNGAGL